MAGLGYEFDNGMVPYIGYTTSFDPVVGSAFGGSPFQPTTGDQWEAGVKKLPAQGNEDPHHGSGF